MRVTTLLLVAALPACVADEPPLGADAGDGFSETEQALASFEGRFEMSSDAPWRLEPRAWTNTGAPEPSAPGCTSGDCKVRYPVLPIQITIDDADQFTDVLDTSGTVPVIGDIYQIDVVERGNGTSHTSTYSPQQLHEIEYQSNAWPAPPDSNPHAPTGYVPDHQVCKTWENPYCWSQFVRIGDKNEWHATLRYTPYTQIPGADIELDVTVHATRLDGAGTKPPFELVDHLRVHLGELPLPKFDGRWAYGDLHYHSQGTDNDGESGYAYRGVLQAMTAIGLDFALASDHASNSRQITDMDIFDITQWPPVSEQHQALRDMSPDRYPHLHDWIYGPGGANQQVLSFRWQDWGLTAVPQLLLGGEVDAQVEMNADDLANGIKYGNGKRYEWWKACDDVPYAISGTPISWGCSPFYKYSNGSVIGFDENKVRAGLAEPAGPGRWRLRDPQGLSLGYARQHVLHLPAHPDRDGFVRSDTSEYGGATRSLADVLHDDDALGGYTFLAHPLAAAGGDGTGRLGPDLVPYTETELGTAFASPHVLGLQLWNEDGRNSTPIGVYGTSDVDWAAVRDTSHVELDWWDNARWTWYHQNNIASPLYHGAATWDELLLWGLDPARTSQLPWLQAGQPRRVFMAGGSDAHGDLNFRRQGATSGTSEVDDTAIGKPRNLVFAGAPNGAWSHEQIAAGLASGRFSVTDGPALRIAIDTNHNGVIDDTDVPMGGVNPMPKGAHVPIVVEWMSTAEFGRATKLDLYVGVFSDAVGTGMVYAPFDAGVRGPNDPATSVVRTSQVIAPSRTITLVQTSDHYYADSYDLRRANPATDYGAINHASFDLDPGVFPVVQFDCNDQPVRAELPDRLYVRAFLRTVKDPPPGRTCDPLREECVERWAYANPVWVTSGWSLPSTTATGTISTAPAFEPTSANESVRIDPYADRTFDRGYNSACYGYSWSSDPARSTWAIQWRTSSLGWSSLATIPISPVGGWLIDGGQYQHFSNNASVYFNPHAYPGRIGSGGCAYYIGWGIRAAWFNTGYEWGNLGYPLTDERVWNGGAYQYFDKGAIFWKPNTGSIALRGQLAARHLEAMRQGFAAFPTWSWTIASPAGQAAMFENGNSIYWSSSTGARIVSPPFLGPYQAQGGPTGTLGYPVAEYSGGPDGWTYQRFSGGALFQRSGAPMCQQTGAFHLPTHLPDRPAP